MAYAQYVREYIDHFLEDIGPVESLYRDNSFSYLAIRQDEGFAIVRGTLFLNTTEPQIPYGKFETSRVRAGHFPLSEAGVSARELIEFIGTGSFETPHGPLLFPLGSNDHGAQYKRFHEAGLPAQQRLSVLALLGAECAQLLYANQPDLDWEVRSAPCPYDGIQELLLEYRPGVLEGVSRIEVAAFNLVAIDMASIVDGETAHLSVRTVPHAPKERVSVGYRILDQGKTVGRGAIAGADLEWEIADGVLRGSATLSVPRAAIVHAFARFDDTVYQHYFFGDPTSFQNPRRASYETFDPRLEILRDILSKAQQPKPDARDFEAAIAWLFWMLGFAPANVGAPRRMSDSADFLAAAPNGNIAVVECTVGLLKEDRKLPKLHDRTEAVRRSLDSSSTRHIRVLPVIVTAKTLVEIQPDIEQAEKLGVFVIARDGIERLMDQTLILQNADQLYEEAELAVAAAKEKHTPS